MGNRDVWGAWGCLTEQWDIPVGFWLAVRLQEGCFVFSPWSKGEHTFGVDVAVQGVQRGDNKDLLEPVLMCKKRHMELVFCFGGSFLHPGQPMLEHIHCRKFRAPKSQALKE